MLALAIVSLGLMWIVFSKYAVPPLIEKAYRGESLPFFNKMISGQASHPIAEYLSEWDRTRWRVLLDFFLVGLLAVLAMRPEYHKALWGSATRYQTVPVLADEKAFRSVPPHASRRRVYVGLVLLAFCSTGAARIVSTYHVFSQTVDEPDHVASGMEWLDRGSYTADREHPPLARVLIALGPFLDGLRLPPEAGDYIHDYNRVGNQILYTRNRYSRNLALARLGVLPFFFLAAGMVFVWSRKAFGDTSALLATLMFTTLPPVLAHGGLATTDMAIAATFITALLAFVYLLECPTYFRSCTLGLTAGLAILSKLSALLFLPACGLAVLACRWKATRLRNESPAVPWGRRAIAIALTEITTFLVIWGAYRFSVKHITRNARPHESTNRFLGAEGTLHRLPYLVAEHAWIPAPELLTGINLLRLHAERGGTSYLLGEVRQTGWWYFFPIALAVKTPLPFLILTGFGLIILGRHGLRGGDWCALAPAATALTLLLVCMPSRINFGVRHILPIYPLLAIVAGFGAVKLWNLSTVGRAAVIALLLWQTVSSARIHPDYLAYFNEFAGARPERVLVVSDLDWGQDFLRLSDTLRAWRITSVVLAVHGTADPGHHHLPAWSNLPPCQPATGWIAASEMALKIGRSEPPYGGWEWLEDYEPTAFVGKSIRLYHIPDRAYIRMPDECQRAGQAQ